MGALKRWIHKNSELKSQLVRLLCKVDSGRSGLDDSLMISTKLSRKPQLSRDVVCLSTHQLRRPERPRPDVRGPDTESFLAAVIRTDGT